MSWSVKLRGGETLTVGDEQGSKLKAVLMMPKNTRPDTVEIKDNLYRVAEIVRVVKTSNPIPQMRQERLIPEGKTCRGQRSIQLEIMKVIRQRYPRDWGKRLQSTSFKEEVRKKLRAANPDVKWCDYKAKECVCDDKNPGPDMSVIHNIFFGEKSSDKPTNNATPPAKKAPLTPVKTNEKTPEELF